MHDAVGLKDRHARNPTNYAEDIRAPGVTVHYKRAHRNLLARF